MSMGLDAAIIFFAKYFPYLVGLAFVVFVLRPRFSRVRLRFLIEGLVAGFIARGGVEIIRLFIHRPRPFVDDHAITPLFSETSFSFPSGHAAFFFALSAVVYTYDTRWGAWFFAASSLIVFARVAAGVHYPSDIIGGAVLGILIGWAVVRFSRHLMSTDGLK